MLGQQQQQGREGGRGEDGANVGEELGLVAGAADGLGVIGFNVGDLEGDSDVGGAGVGWCRSWESRNITPHTPHTTDTSSSIAFATTNLEMRFAIARPETTPQNPQLCLEEERETQSPFDEPFEQQDDDPRRCVQREIRS